jgi:hypothetical protein
MASDIEIFLCYAQEDELLCKELLIHLGGLKRQNFFDLWHDREINAGTEYEPEIDKHLNTAKVILLLISQYFMNSNYCYLKELQKAIERHDRGEARVIPVILRPVFYQRAPFAKLMPLPMNKKPVTHSSWHSLDEAFFDVAEGIRKSVEELSTTLSVQTQAIPLQAQKYSTIHPPQAIRGTEQAKTKFHHFKPGQKVRHSLFGEGVILKSEIESGTEFVEVQFSGKHGKKRLSMDFARLERV